MDKPSRRFVDRTVRHLPDAVWAPVAATLLTGVLGIVTMVVGHAALFPSLGPTVFLQTFRPSHRSARAYNVAAGQSIGVAAGVVAAVLTGAAFEPSIIHSAQIRPDQLVAAVIAVPLTMILQRLTRSVHPPAASTALLVTLGGFRVEPVDMATIALGITVVTVTGEGMRRLRLRSLSS